MHFFTFGIFIYWSVPGVRERDCTILTLTCTSSAFSSQIPSHINIRSINSKKKLSEANTCAQTCSVETKRIHSAFFSSSLHTLPFLCVFFCSVYSGFVKIPSKEQTTRMFSVARIQYVSERAARRIGNYEHDISFNY